ncbi:MAG: terminase family protein [Planctomycetota bacterium]
MAITMGTGVHLELPHDISDAWRLFPDTYAHRISGGSWYPYAWIKYAMGIVHSEVRKGNARIILNVGSRLGKSDAFSKYFPLHHLEEDPSRKIMLVSYAADLAREQFGRWLRNEVETNDLVRLQLRKDSTAVGRWHTPEGGGMIAAGMAGSLIGVGFNLCIVDDPHKNWAEAHSHRQREAVIEWFSSTLMSRKEPNASIIVVHQRWHEDDLTGHLLAQDDTEWMQISLPLIAEDDDPLGREIGDPLCPERFDREACDRIRRDMPGNVFDAMFQQRPRSGGSNLAYPNFSERNVEDSVELRDDLPLVLALDFNINPGMHGLIGQYDPLEDEFLIAHELHEFAMSIVRPPGEDGPSLITAFDRWITSQGGFRWPELRVYGDPSGRNRTDTTGMNRFQVLGKGLQSLGIPFSLRVKASHPAVVSRLSAVNDALCDVQGRRHARIARCCERLRYDLKNNKLVEDGSDIDKTKREWTHAGDAFGYLVEYERQVRIEVDASLGQFNV